MNLDIAVAAPLAVTVDDRVYTVEFPLPSVVALEKAIKRSMKTAQDWFKISTAELPDVLWAGLLKHHQDDALRVASLICNGLNPEAIETTIDAVCAAAWPEAMRKYQEIVEKLKARAEQGLPLPNVQSAVVH